MFPFWFLFVCGIHGFVRDVTAERSSQSSSTITLARTATFRTDACGSSFGTLVALGAMRAPREKTAAIWSAGIVLPSAATRIITDTTPNIKCAVVNVTNVSASFVWTTEDLQTQMDVIVQDGGLLHASVRFGSSVGAALWNYTVSPGGLVLDIIPNRTQSYRSDGFGIIDDPPQAYAEIYPRATMQWYGLLNTSENTSFYFAAHDPNAHSKTFQMKLLFNDTAATSSVAVIPPDAGLSLPSVPGPAQFPIVMAAVPDATWWDLAQIYRKFVLSDPDILWTRRGPLAMRNDVPPQLYNLTTFVNSHWQNHDVFNVSGGDPTVVLERVTNISKRFNLPPGGSLGLHWYEWDLLGYAPGSHYGNCTSGVACGFDTHYPTYFPVRHGFNETLRTLQANDVRVFPYINGRIFDTDAPAWSKKAHNAATKFASEPFYGEPDPANLSLYQESYGSQATFAVECPHTAYWQDTISSVVRTLMHEYGTDGVYVDQIAAAGPKPCFDPSHGHPLGGGNHWVTGYDAMLEKMQDKKKILLTGSNAEPFGGGIDLFLTLVGFGHGSLPNVPSSSRIVPAFQAIYGGYFMSVGAEFYASDLDADPDVFASKVAAQFIFGALMGWFSLGGRRDTSGNPYMGLYERLMDPKYDAEIDYVRELAAARRRASDFLIHGRAGAPLPIGVNGTEPTTTPTGLMASTWIYEKEVMVVLTTTNRSVPVFSARGSINVARMGLKSSDRYGIFQDDIRLPGTFDAQSVSFDVPIGVRSVVLLTVKAVDNERGHASYA